MVLILIFSDVLREIRRGIAENLKKRDFPIAEDNEVVVQLNETAANEANRLLLHTEANAAFNNVQHLSERAPSLLRCRFRRVANKTCS